MAAHRLRQLCGRQIVLVAMSSPMEHVNAARHGGDFDHAIGMPVDVHGLFDLVWIAANLTSLNS